MQAGERQKRIEAYLQKVEFASLEELATHVGASQSTVRRDLTVLEGTGTIRRTHGGARVVNPRSDEFIFSRRDTIQLTEKQAIGEVCAQLIQPRQSVIIDAGTTAFHVAQFLQGRTLQIITNSLPVANLFASSADIEVVVSGGVIYPRLGVLVGPLAVETFTKTHADVAVMSAGGITLEGVTNSHALLIDIQRAMIDAASRVIFCLDHTKIGRRSVAHLCELSRLHTVITDAATPKEWVTALRERGLEVLVAGETNAAPAASTAPPSTPNRQEEEPSVAASAPKLQPLPSGGTELGGGMSWD